MHFDAKQRHDWFPKKRSKKEKEPARDMEWETAYDAEPGSDWAPPASAKKEKRAHKDLVKWQHCFRDNCSVYRWEKVDAGYYPRIVGKDGVLSRQDETHNKRRRTVRTWHEGEGGEITFSDVERLEKDISKNIPCARCPTVASGYQAQDISAHDPRCVPWLFATLACARCVRGSIAIPISLWRILAT